MKGKQRIPANSQGSWFHGIADHLRLVWRLWTDNRINLLLKLLPFGSLVYLISPFDLPTPIDDIGVIYLFTYLFVEMSPPEIVAEHRKEIESMIDGQWKQSLEYDEISEQEIIDAEYSVKDD